MEIKQKYRYRKAAGFVIAAILMIASLVFCFSAINSINQRMNDSATANLLSTTKVIEETLETYIDKDFESLNVIGELYKAGEPLADEQIEALCSTMGFEWIGVADEQGNSVGNFAGSFDIQEMAWREEWEPEKTGYSDAYFGESGRLQTTLWVPVYRGDEFIGTVFGDIVLTKYYSANKFTFYEGAGRTYLVDGSDGKWILRSLGTDGASRRQDDIYSLLIDSGNEQEEVKQFQHAVSIEKTGTAVFDFNGERSYICFMPLSSSADWYIITVIAKEVLLKESTQIQRMIQMIFTVFCITLIILAVTFAVWQNRKTKEKEADYREALFANVSANIDSAFMIYEKKSRKTVFVSENVRRLLGLDRKWLGKDAGNLFEWCKIPEEDVQRQDFMKGTLKDPVIREVRLEDKTGVGFRYIRLELIPADLGQEIAVLTDITKDKDIQSSLVEAMEQAENASRAKNDFLSAMSHDIRTPMNGVVGMTAIAAAHLDDRNRVKECLGKISEASAHLLNIINEVLDMSQIESGKIELTDESFNLAELLQEVLNMNYPGIQEKNHSLKVRIQSMHHEKVIGDPVRFQRIASNLISNAVKYTPDGGMIVIALNEKEPVISGYGCYELIVQDNGIGMSEEFMKRLFQPFEREEDVRISRIQGTGLGMSIVKNLVSLMMGNVEVESEKNKGSIFRVTVNLRLDVQDMEQEEKLVQLPVLVVDDDLVTCESVSGMLCDIGMIGEWADSGALAVQMAEERHNKRRDYMAVILDWKMPEMDGLETARQIRAKVGTEVPIIILTAYDWGEIEEEARAAGVDTFLSKPIYKTKLRQKMLSVADGSKEVPVHQESGLNNMIPEGKRVLLVEDNELNKEIAAELLRMMNVEVEIAADGVEAVERFTASETKWYDLIMMDIQMPRMNGYEATREIRSMDRPDSQTIPIVAMTADAFAKDVQAVRAVGMNEHVAKPISVDRLYQVLVKFLGKTDASAEDMEGNGNEKIH